MIRYITFLQKGQNRLNIHFLRHIQKVYISKSKHILTFIMYKIYKSCFGKILLHLENLYYDLSGIRFEYFEIVKLNRSETK